METTTTGPNPAAAGNQPFKRNIAVMALTSGMNVGSMMLWAPVLSLFMRDLGASDVIIGVANAAWMILSASCQYLGGRLSDRFGRVPVIAWPGVLSGLAIAACAMARSWQVFAVLYAFYHAGHAIQGPVFSSIIGESVPMAERGRAFSRNELAIGIGVVSGPLIGSVLMPVIGIRGLLAISGVLFVAAGAVRLTQLRETRPDGAHSAVFQLKHLLQPTMARAMIVLIAVNAVLCLTLWGPFLSLHASDVMGLSRPAINQLSSAGSAAGILVTFVAGHAVTRLGAAKVLRLAIPGLAIVAVLWSWQRSVAQVFAWYIAMYAVFEFMMIASDTFRVQAVPDEVRGRALGAMGMFNGLATAPLVPLASALRATSGSGAPFFLALLPAAAGLWAVISWGRTHTPRQVVRPVASSSGPGTGSGGASSQA